MALQPLGSRILVEAVKRQDDGIIIPESARTQEQEKATVIAVGPGIRLQNGQISTLWVKAGDVVYYNPFGGSKIKSDNKEYTLLNEEDILAVEI